MGEKAYWRELLYQSKAAELILYGRALGLSHGEAEDVLHETFLALIRRADVPSKPAHYCVRAFRNRALNYRRGIWRRLAREWESRWWFERSGSETPAEEEAMRCLAKLCREQREVVVLKIWHQYTFQEIAELLEIPPNTAAGRYRYALQRMRKAMEGSAYERDERLGEVLHFLETAPPIGGS